MTNVTAEVLLLSALLVMSIAQFRILNSMLQILTRIDKNLELLNLTFSGLNDKVDRVQHRIEVLELKIEKATK